MNRPLRLFVAFTFCICISSKTFAQQTIQPSILFEFTSEEDNRLIKENDSLKFYVASGDTSNVVCIDEEDSYYKLLNKERKLIAEGAFIADGEKYLQAGKWNAYYAGAKVKLTGYYEKGRPVGTWQEFYSSGKLKTVYNYAIIDDKGVKNSCLSGSYQEFYQSVKLKVNGFYVAVSTTVHDTVVIEDPIENKKLEKVMSRKTYSPEKTGHWEYYTESGELDKKEDL